MSSREAVVLARVSSSGQETEGYSLPAQEKFLREYCERKDLTIKKFYTISESASGKKQREAFTEMMDYIDSHKVKTLVCEKVDRLTRNFRDAVMIDDWLESDMERQVHLVKDTLVLHKNSRSQEKLNWGVRIIFAKNYIDNLKEEVDKGVKEKLAQGWLPAKPPLGYKTIGESGKKIHIIDPDTAPLVKKLFELYASGNHSLSTLVVAAKDMGLRTGYGRPIVKSHMAKMMAHQFYIGKNPWNGKVYEGAHEPLISEVLFNQVQAQLNRKSAPKYGKHNPLFKGVLHCEDCGGMITWELQRGHWYGACKSSKSCPKKRYVREEEIERQLQTRFDELVCPSPAIIEWVTEALRAKHAEEMGTHDASVKQLKARHADNKRRIDILYDDRLDGRITPQRYDSKFKEMTEEQEGIVRQLSKSDNDYARRLESGLQMLTVTQRAAEIYKTKPDEVRRELLRAIFSNISYNGDSLGYKYTPLVEAIANRAEQHRELNKKFEQANNDSVETKNTLIGASRSIWLSMTVWNLV